MKIKNPPRLTRSMNEHASQHHTQHHREAWVRKNHPDITSDIMGMTKTNGRIRGVLVVLAVLGAIGIISLIVKLVLFNGEQAKWGYTAATMSFILTVGGGAPMVSIAAALAKGHWAKPLQRISVIFSLTGVVTAILMIPLLFQLPPLVTEGARRRSVWFEAPDYSPHTWGLIAVLTLLTTGLALFYSSALPDFAVMRDHGTGWRKRVGASLARGWVGTDMQWRALRLRIGMFGTLYFLFLIFTHFLISTDFDMSLVPGWRDAIYPMYHAMTSLQAGVAAVVLLAWASRKWFGAKDYLQLDQFWALGRLLFATTLMWFYFWFSGFIVFWYGRTAADQAYLDLLIRGPMVWAFVLSAAFSFITPWWWLIWNRVRTSVNGPAIAAVIILFGILLDRVRLYVPAWSVPPNQIHDRFLQTIPSTVWPDVFDILIIVGMIALSAAIVLGATRAVPVLSVWQLQEYNLLGKPVKYLRTRGILIAKPD